MNTLKYDLKNNGSLKIAVKLSKPIKSMDVDTFEKLNPNDITAGINKVMMKNAKNGNNMM
ncbi:hypothetical protein SDC9_202008 [bioreactor metagenome]|uniref:Uncharacterized protein n=1 Tax=bioreactor metagenome TaxID=1076179 RepID=A0A645ISH6_9ZZZZ